jgi:hypothetical protein
MKLFIQAVQTVTVELAGVVLVVWLLFGFASWGLRSAMGGGLAIDRRPAAATAAPSTPARAQIAGAPVAGVSDQERAEFVARTLGRYGRMLGSASENLLREVSRIEL